MKRRFPWVRVLATLTLPDWSVAADGFALLGRGHVGRVKAVDPSGARMVVDGVFHDNLFREIPVILVPAAPIISPDVVNRTRRVSPGEIRPGKYAAPECVESGKRHAARKLTITSTEEEERMQRAFMKAGRDGPPGFRDTGMFPR